MRAVRRLIPLALAAYAATGFYVVGPDEQAVVRRFGKLVPQPRFPGLQYDWPWGLSQVVRIKPAQTKRIAVGRLPGLMAVSSQRLSEFLTGDQNILHVQATAQYTIAVPAAYVLHAREVEPLLADAVESELNRAIAQSRVDDVLGEGGPQIQEAVLRGAQHIINRYGLGVTIRSVNLDSVLPPDEVVEDFRQAQDARNLRDLLIHQAEADERRRIQEAQSQAQEITDQAAAYREQVVQHARGAGDRFLALLKEYQRAKSLTAARLYVETLERVLPRLKAKLIVGEGQEVDLSILRRDPQ